MRNDKVLLNISTIADLERYKKLGIANFLFPLKDFSVGYESFTFEEIEKTRVNAYILVNRILTDEDLDRFVKLEIPKNVKGFLIEDTGLMCELTDKGYELISFQNHLNNNYETINYWLDYFTSVVLSTDITGQEIEEILDYTTKPLVLQVFAYPMVMYSRRTLTRNYLRHRGEDEKDHLDVAVPNADIHFKLRDNDYGTAVFDANLLDIRDFAESLDAEKIKFFLFDTHFLSSDLVEAALEGKPIENTTTGFIDKKTVYRVGDLK